MRCPRCDGDLDPAGHDPEGMVTCRCGHRAYAGFVAEADALAARSAWLADRVRAGDPAPPPDVRTAYGIWSPPAPRAGPGAGPAGVDRPAPAGLPSAQTILLGVGAVLLVVAGAVFAAVVWDRLGAGGQVSLMLAATAGVGALAVRLRASLRGTAESLAVVAGGLAIVDLMAAPLLGLLPEHWIEDPTLYPAVAFGMLGGALLGLHRGFGLRAWSWLGWGAVLTSAVCLVAAVAAATDSDAVVAASVSAPALASIAMLAAAQLRLLGPDHRPALATVGGFGLFVSGAATAALAVERSALPGAVLTTAAAALAVGLWAAQAGPGARLVTLGAGALAGIAVALVLGLPTEPQQTWLAAAAALAGLAAGMVASLLATERWLPVVAALAVWATWAVLRISTVHDAATQDAVSGQLALLAALVAVIGYVAAWWVPGWGWVAAVLGATAMLLVPGDDVEPVEVYSLSFAAMLLGAGLLWRRHGPSPTLLWLGPAVAMAVVPSAFATWAAPWALDLDARGATWHLVRLGAVLAAAVVCVVVGARLQAGGLLLPAAVALLFAASAQVWGGLSALPRWVGLGLAGTLLVVAGARIEYLRDRGRRAAEWVERLR